MTLKKLRFIATVPFLLVLFDLFTGGSLGIMVLKKLFGEKVTAIIIIITIIIFFYTFIKGAFSKENEDRWDDPN